MVTNYFTFTLNFLDTPLLVTVMVAVPFFLPFTTPFAVTVATFLLLDLYVTFPDGVAVALILLFAFLDCCRRFCKLQRRVLNLDYYFLSVISNLYSNGCLSRFFRFYNTFRRNSSYFLVAGFKFNFSSYIIFYNRNGCRGFPLV